MRPPRRWHRERDAVLGVVLAEVRHDLLERRRRNRSASGAASPPIPKAPTTTVSVASSQ